MGEGGFFNRLIWHATIAQTIGSIKLYGNDQDAQAMPQKNVSVFFMSKYFWAQWFGYVSQSKGTSALNMYENSQDM